MSIIMSCSTCKHGVDGAGAILCLKPDHDPDCTEAWEEHPLITLGRKDAMLQVLGLVQIGISQLPEYTGRRLSSDPPELVG